MERSFAAEVKQLALGGAFDFDGLACPRRGSRMRGARDDRGSRGDPAHPHPPGLPSEPVPPALAQPPAERVTDPVADTGA